MEAEDVLPGRQNEQDNGKCDKNEEKESFNDRHSRHAQPKKKSFSSFDQTVSFAKQHLSSSLNLAAPKMLHHAPKRAVNLCGEGLEGHHAGCCVVCQISVIRTKLILYHQLQLRLCELVHWCFVRLV